VSTLREICGSWMFVRSDGDLNLAEVRIRAVDENESLDGQIAAWQREDGHRTVAPVRRILQAAGPLVDLVTGAVVSASFSVDSVVKLLKMSRRSVDFLLQTKEVSL
jgi:hypothetical protein